MGDGRQWMPWIHERDVTSLLIHARDHLALTGPLNVVSPGLATNAQFTESLGRALRRPTLLTVPRFALGVALGEMKTLVLSSQRVIPSKAQETAFRFEFEKLETALEDCVRA